MSSWQVKPIPAAPEGRAAPDLLAPLRRPEFLNGQLLTEEDLDDTVKWSDRRFKLGHWKSGSGVVHGLVPEVMDDKASLLRITRGFAVDPVLQEILIDNDIEIPASNLIDYVDNDTAIEDWRSEGSFTYDIYIRYREKARAPRPTIARQTDERGLRCGYTRYFGSFELVLTPADTTRGYDYVRTSAADAWRRTYQAATEPLRAFIDAFGDQVDIGERTRILDWLKDRLTGNPIEYFPAAMSHLSDIADAGDQAEFFASVRSLLFHLVLDKQQQFLGDTENDPGDIYRDDRILLGRVSVDVCVDRGDPCDTDDDRFVATITNLDSAPPLRDNQKVDGYPAPPGRREIVEHVIGSTFLSAEGSLAEKNMKPGGLSPFYLSGEQSLEGLLDRLSYDPTASYWDRPILLTGDISGLGERIVAIDNSVERPRVDTRIDINYATAKVRPGETTRLKLRIINTGRTIFTMSFDDLHNPNLSGENLRLLPDGVFEFETDFIAPSDVTHTTPSLSKNGDGNFDFRSTLKVFATLEDGSEFEWEYAHGLVVLAPIDLSLTMTSDEIFFMPGRRVHFDLYLRNSGVAELEVDGRVNLHAAGFEDVEDELLRIRPVKIAPGQREHIHFDWLIPRNNDLAFAHLKANAIGVSQDGRETRASGDMRLKAEDLTRGFWHIMALFAYWVRSLFGLTRVS